MLLFIPPLLVGYQHRLGIGNAAVELERAGAIGVVGGVILGLRGDIGWLFCLVVGEPLRIEHEDIGHIIEEERGWR